MSQVGSDGWDGTTGFSEVSVVKWLLGCSYTLLGGWIATWQETTIRSTCMKQVVCCGTKCRSFYETKVRSFRAWLFNDRQWMARILCFSRADERIIQSTADTLKVK